MAKIRFGPTITGASGSVDGTTYSHNTFGSYLRRRGMPVNPNTSKQTIVRDRLVGQSQTWRTLTDAQRNTWNALAPTITKSGPLGITYSPSGFGAFSMNNLTRLAAGMAVVTSAPLLDASPTVSALSITVNGTTPAFSITYTQSGGTANNKLLIYATGAVSAGRNFFRQSDFRLIASIAGNTASPYDAKTAYEAVFGALATGIVGNRVAVRIVPVSQNGWRGTDVQASTVVV